MRRVALALLGLVLSSGCTGSLRRVTVPVDEYAEYRRFRVAGTVERKLAAGYEYLRHNPSGAYRKDVSDWFWPAQKHYVDRSWGNAPRLEVFLAAVPAGPEAERAANRLVELRLTKEFRERREKAFNQKTDAMLRRLSKAEEGRHELVNGVAAWARRLAAFRGWGARTADLDSDFLYAYRLSEPAAQCNDEKCWKTIIVSYDVPELKAQSARQAVYDVQLELDRDGGVRSAMITGPELFTRIGEAVRVAAVTPSDWLGRTEAIGQAAQMLALAVEPSLPAARCAAEAVSPVVLRRVCDGVELRVISALDLSEEDRMIIEPSKSP